MLGKKADADRIDIVGTVKSTTLELRGIDCRINFPLTPHKNPKVTLYCDATSAKQLTQTEDQWFHIEGKEDDNYFGFATVVAQGLNLHSHKFKRSGIALSAIPMRLKIVRRIGSDKIAPGGAKVVFWLTNKNALSFLRGSVITLEQGTDLKATYSPDGWPILEFDIPQDNDPEKFIEVATEQIEDYLALISLATRERVLWTRWQYSNSAETVHFQRYHFNTPEPRTVYPLIDPPTDIVRFLGVALTSLHSFRKYLLRSIFYVVPLLSENRTIESDYIVLFAALEMLVLSFRERTNREFIFNEEWPTLRDAIRTDIERMPARLSLGGDAGTKIKLIVNNVDGLNRLALGKAFKAFCECYNLGKEDQNRFFALKGLRNRLVHGTPLDVESGFLSATFELKCLVEKMILVMLGWDPNGSTVSDRYIKALKSRYYK